MRGFSSWGTTTVTGSLLALLAHSSLLGTAVAASFTDLAPDGFYLSAVERLAQDRIITGHRDQDGHYLGTFRPDDNVTLAEVLKMAIRAARIPLTEARVPSNLSAQGTWVAPYMNVAAKLHFSVFKDNRLDIFRPATRGEAFQILREAFHAAPPTSTVSASALITRGQFAVFLNQMLPFASAPIATTTTPVAATPSSSAAAVPWTQPVTALMDATHRISAASANMRSGVGIEYRVVRILKNGELLKMLSQPIDTWGEFLLSDGTKGFLNLSSVVALRPETSNPSPTTPAPTPETPAAPSPSSFSGNGSVTGPVNVRTQPDPTARALLSIPAGTPIVILDQDYPSWTHIRLEDGREGYVGTKFVKVGQ